MKGFKIVSLHFYPPLPSLLGAMGATSSTNTLLTNSATVLTLTTEHLKVERLRESDWQLRRRGPAARDAADSRGRKGVVGIVGEFAGKIAPL
jgi:hypothetical protein